MTPKMVAFELAHHIEDIFADHDVEILAVDADEDEGDSDDDTFVSARSRRSARSTRSVRSLMMAKKLAEKVSGADRESKDVLAEGEEIS